MIPFFLSYISCFSCSFSSECKNWRQMRAAGRDTTHNHPLTTPATASTSSSTIHRPTFSRTSTLSNTFSAPPTAGVNPSPFPTTALTSTPPFSRPSASASASAASKHHRAYASALPPSRASRTAAANSGAASSPPASSATTSSRTAPTPRRATTLPRRRSAVLRCSGSGVATGERTMMLERWCGRAAARRVAARAVMPWAMRVALRRVWAWAWAWAATRLGRLAGARGESGVGGWERRWTACVAARLRAEMSGRRLVGEAPGWGRKRTGGLLGVPRRVLWREGVVDGFGVALVGGFEVTVLVSVPSPVTLMEMVSPGLR